MGWGHRCDRDQDRLQWLRHHDHVVAADHAMAGNRDMGNMAVDNYVMHRHRSREKRTTFAV